MPGPAEAIRVVVRALRVKLLGIHAGKLDIGGRREIAISHRAVPCSSHEKQANRIAALWNVGKEWRIDSSHCAHIADGAALI